jgi:hypothetical protein
MKSTVDCINSRLDTSDKMANETKEIATRLTEATIIKIRLRMNRALETRGTTLRTLPCVTEILEGEEGEREKETYLKNNAPSLKKL